jgi:hypothetical protein
MGNGLTNNYIIAIKKKIQSEIKNMDGRNGGGQL